jgi:hypothetical protein
MNKVDYKKVDKELYQPSTEPEVIHVPEMKFIQINGKGNPNDMEGEYPKAVETLYALSYGIKMLPKNGMTPDGYFDYVVPPLEGLWWFEDYTTTSYMDKSKFIWTAMIRQPEFVTDELFKKVQDKVIIKKPALPILEARLVSFEEGLCVQCMHIGSFDEERKTVDNMDLFIENHRLLIDFSESRNHHEIYLSDPRKTNVSKLKTIIRHPVKQIYQEK